MKKISFLILSVISLILIFNEKAYSKTAVVGEYKFELKYTHAIQSYARVGRDVYIKQAYSKNEFEEFEAYGQNGEENLMLITRCEYDKETESYKAKEYMLLRNVGHGQTLEAYKFRGRVYFLISCGSIKNYYSKIWWSKQIGRIEFKPGTVLENNKIKRLTYLNYANKKRSRFGDTKRVDATLSPNKKTLLIWKLNEKNVSEITAYDFTKLNRMLDRLDTNELNAKESKPLSKAVIFTIRGIKNSPQSFQGFAITDISRDKECNFYISSGDERYVKGGICIYSYKIKKNKIKYENRIRLDAGDIWDMYKEEEGENYEEVEADDDYFEVYSDADETSSDWEFMEMADYYAGVLAEIEDLKILGNSFQFIVRDTGNQRRQILCSIPIEEIRVKNK